MTDTNGLDVLIAWAVFVALLSVLGFFVLRSRVDPVDEAKRRTDGSRIDDPRNQRIAAGEHRPQGGTTEPW
jgi:hypothetical protein